MDSIPQKTCTRCRQTKPLDTFPHAAGKRDGRSSWCRQCTNNHNKQRYQDDATYREHVKAAALTLYHTNADYQERQKQRARGVAVVSTQPKRAIPIRDDPSAQAKYRNRETQRNQDRRLWYQMRGQKRRADPAEAKKLRVRGRVYAHNYRARRRENGGAFTLAEWEQLCVYYDHRCLCCDEQKPLSPDHVIPVSKGGPNTIDNIQPLCETCNKSKGNKTIDYRTSRTSSAT